MFRRQPAEALCCPVPLPAQRLIIYPDYLNAAKTVAEGRRIPKDKGV